MRFQLFVLAFALFSSHLVAAPGRAPAVEDFVGIEIEHPDTSPQGKDSLYNLEKDMNELQQVEAKAYLAPAPAAPKSHVMNQPNQFIQWTPVNIAATFLLIVLPLLSWYVALNRLRRKATVENASNIEVLEKYRRERERARKQEEEYKKAS